MPDEPFDRLNVIKRVHIPFEDEGEYKISFINYYNHIFLDFNYQELQRFLLALNKFSDADSSLETSRNFVEYITSQWVRVPIYWEAGKTL